MTDSDIIKLPIWKEKYTKLGVTPRELYMRQNGLCWLVPAVDSEGSVEIFCTDDVDRASTSCMLNPTIECVRCMTTFITRVIENETKKDK